MNRKPAWSEKRAGFLAPDNKPTNRSTIVPMNAHEMIDRFGSKSPRFKVAVALIIAAIVFGSLGLAFWLGSIKGSEWADSKYLQERAEREKAIAVLEANANRNLATEKQLAAENALLKKANEATAEILSQRDKQAAAAEAKKFTDLAKEREKRYETIDADTDFDSQLCGLCSDARRAGHQLSESLCGRCKGNP